MPNMMPGASEKLRPQEATPQDESGLEADERVIEAQEVQGEHFLEEEEKEQVPTTQAATTAGSAAVQAPAIVKDDVVLRVEKILEQGLGDLYERLPEDAKPKFKAKGEEVSVELAQMARSLKLKWRRALELIRDWLLIIPGVNKFFLEQEAKLKVDLLADYVEEKKREHLEHP